MPIVALDIFCGCGGVTYGLAKAGIRVAVGVDVDEDCRLTYVLNNPRTRFVSADVRKVSGNALLEYPGGFRQGDYLLLAACAPCQPFSLQNRFRREAADRTVLCHVERLVRELLPDFLLMENVPGIQRVAGFSAFRRLLQALRNLRYTTRFQIVDAVSYGIPQSRRRLVLLASLHGVVPWPEPTHGDRAGLQRPVTVRDVIGKYPALRAGEAHPTIANHVAAKLAPRNLVRIIATPPDGGGRRDWPTALRVTCHEHHDGHPDVYGRLRWDMPAPTLTTRCTSLSNGRYGHPEQHRAISAREAAALQSFDDSYVFYGTLGAVAAQIGNAVPPVLAERFGAAFVATVGNLTGPKNKPMRRFLNAKPNLHRRATGQRKQVN